jgi:murein DD-endopeptidase MepM/ murein hydrolase activator NlpD
VPKLFQLAKLINFIFVLLLATFSQTIVANSALNLYGELKQGGLIVGKTLPDSEVLFDNNMLAVTETGFFVFGFSRDDKKTHQLEITLPTGQKINKLLTPKARQYKIQRIEGISKKIMNPNTKAIARSQQDSQQIAKARQIMRHISAFSEGFIAPSKGRITGVYGSQRIFNGIPKRPHFGLDYAGKIGTPVIAPASGVVSLFVPDMFYSGGTLIIDHGYGVTSTFLHLSKSYVKVGDTVKKGQKIAEIGATGRVTGPHLDWRVNWFNIKLDPALVLKVNTNH